MSQRRSTVVILCEDRQQEVFARHFLQKRGFPGPFAVKICPKNKQSGEQYMRELYPMEVKAYRSKKNYLAISLVVVIDADKYTVADRLHQLDTALEEDSQPRRQEEEQIAIFVPKRNIETWIYYLQGETVDEETAYPKLLRESDCKSDVEELAQQCPRGLDENAPRSLHMACDELQKILPAS
ncbi:MAG: hypothetical protein GDA43_05235 [Hormoscilla sp. SP5CHS1]|nr:hypothetical protein [Hormoscilla sp. SP5CHS1]